MAKKYIMFLDETGRSLVQTCPFTITGVIFEYKYAVDNKETGANSKLRNKFNHFKRQCFGRDDIPLHLRKILEGHPPFSESHGITKDNLQKFWDTLPDFLEDLHFKIISVTVDKQKLDKYYSTPKDPYVVFAHIMKPLFSFLNDSSVKSIRIVLESRDDYQNLLMQKAFFDIL
ncbi:hypothetical protein [Effusibacillus consociatus]|uniref:DUF3800 domain-containing protein n=1 Tax=Effusibacillus consociatus TaxID=1117041 RepID=A0ABV9PYT6_9BACL